MITGVDPPEPVASKEQRRAALVLALAKMVRTRRLRASLSAAAHEDGSLTVVPVLLDDRVDYLYARINESGGRGLVAMSDTDGDLSAAFVISVVSTPNDTTAPGEPGAVADRKEPTTLSSVLYDALERAIKAVRAHPDLPPITTISQTEEALWVNPYIMGAPLSALLGWHDAMTEQEREFEVVSSDAGSYTKVTVRGLLNDVPVVAQTVTFHELNGQRGRVSLAELRRVARGEEEYS